MDKVEIHKVHRISAWNTCDHLGSLQPEWQLKTCEWTQNALCLISGTLQKNTVCEQCSDGYFSNSSSALETCVRHQECAFGQIVLLPGSVYHDSVCGTCEELANGGVYFVQIVLVVFELLQRKLNFLLTWYKRVSQVRHSGPSSWTSSQCTGCAWQRWGHLSPGETMRVSLPSSIYLCSPTKPTSPSHSYITSSAARQRGPLMHQIKAWLAKAPEEQLRKLPEMLKASHIKIIAEKLETRLMEIQQQSPICSLNLLNWQHMVYVGVWHVGLQAWRLIKSHIPQWDTAEFFAYLKSTWKVFTTLFICLWECMYALPRWPSDVS